MENFLKTYIALMVKTKWITQVGGVAMIAFILYEALLLTVAYERLIEPDLTTFVIMPVVTILCLLGAIIARLLIVRRSGGDNYRPTIMSWWFIIVAVAMYHILYLNYYELRCYFTGRICWQFYAFIGRPDYAQVAGILFVLFSAVRALSTAVIAASVIKSRIK
jgi:hypothetical protein